jgi:hypothetical protein
MEKPKPAEGAAKKPQARLIAIGAGVAAIVLILVLLLSGGDDSEKESEPKADTGGARIVSADELQEAAARQETPVYWAGELPQTELELSQPSDDRTYVRYLTGGADAGNRRADFLTVSTYVQPNAAAALRRQGKEPGGSVGVAPGNATVYFNRATPQSVYLAYPGVPVQIEVYDPNPRRALQLVNSGQIVAIG